MAGVASADVAEKIDFALAYLFERWGELPRVLEEFDDWDVVEQNVFALEWAVPRDFQEDLEQRRGQGLMSEAQTSTHDELLALMVRNRPILDKLLED